ncbi:MAG: rRNA (uracil1939-C5)-methyltransferase [Blastocatellia bacterium]|jgi:23S rRNA (uracil1939-C5)-methyltransferase|nr:rRNA (uracil1939-C5)-methyltransferase [Blastocatellia bacterium]
MISTATGLQDKSILEVEIERILPGGLGLAHAEGSTIFVTLAAPGDVLRVAIDRIRGKVAFANIVEILKPSPERVEPPCPYFGRCGGCDFQQLNYEAQLKAKEEIIRDCLRRLGGIESPPEITMMPSPDPWHYRARAEWQYDQVNQRLGYFERGSRTVCDVAECAVLVPALEQQLEELRTRMRSGALPEHTRDFQAAAGDDGVSLSPTLVDAVATREVTRTIAGERYHFNAEAFFQTNLALLPALLESAIGNASGDTAVDLYCGVGLFTLPLARRFARVVAVETNGRATSFARRNLEFARKQTTANDNAQVSVDEGSAVQPTRSSLGDVRIVTARVGDWLAESSGSFGKVDFLLLDPPRTGAENRDIAGIHALRPRKISYVSCDPATLARDLKKLIGGGYNLESVAAFDMFPQTHHVETVARLAIRERTQSP